ncbi:MAG TPA: hypothetical protein VL172_03295, partial [Kofleriaceae bacterium]|nr:hypothetical protein [Kofleriaceae bacterium]
MLKKGRRPVSGNLLRAYAHAHAHARSGIANAETIASVQRNLQFREQPDYRARAGAGARARSSLDEKRCFAAFFISLLGAVDLDRRADPLDAFAA